MLKRGQRGQAIFETALFMPIILLGLFGTFLAVTQGAMSERAQSAIRYGGIISSIQNPYMATSLYAMYLTLDGQNPEPTGYSYTGVSNNCSAVSAAETGILTTNRHTFWQPSAGGTTSTCWTMAPMMLANNPSLGLYDFIYHENWLQMSAQTPVSSFLSNGALRGEMTVSSFASEDFITIGTVGDALTCTYIGQTVKSSLEAGGYYPPLDNYSNGGGWTGGTVWAPLPVSSSPILIDTPFPLVCPQTFGPQVLQTAPPS